LGKGEEEEVSGPGLVERLEIRVVVDDDFIGKEALSSPAAILLILCFTCRPLFMGIFSGKEEAQDSITDGSGAIEKLGGSCEGM